jgi:hypothetical protein
MTTNDPDENHPGLDKRIYMALDLLFAGVLLFSAGELIYDTGKNKGYKEGQDAAASQAQGACYSDPIIAPSSDATELPDYLNPIITKDSVESTGATYIIESRFDSQDSKNRNDPSVIALTLTGSCPTIDDESFLGFYFRIADNWEHGMPKSMTNIKITPIRLDGAFTLTSAIYNRHAHTHYNSDTLGEIIDTAAEHICDHDPAGKNIIASLGDPNPSN